MSLDNIEIRIKSINNDIKDDIFTSIIAEESPIVMQLEELGYDNIYSRRVFYYLHPENLEEALNYMAIENGIIQHRFIQGRNNSNNICYICGEIRGRHMNEINELSENNNINNNGNINSFNKFEEEKKQEDKIIENSNKKYDINIDVNNNDNENTNNKSRNKNETNSIFDQTDQKIILPNDSFKLNQNKNKKEQTIPIKIEEEIKTKEEKMECTICNEIFIVNQKNKVEKCGHAFCPECWHDSLSVKIKENKLPSIKCLDYNCKEKLTDEFIINLLNSDIYLIKIYRRYKLELEIINDPNKKICPYPNCDSYLELKQNHNKEVKCKNNHNFCFRCLQKPHGDLPCNENLDESMVEYSKNNFVKKCPNCSIVIEKNKGCNHITCTKCGYQWCWLCNKEYSINHFKEGKCKGFQFFQPKNENDVKLMMEGKIDINKLSMSQRQVEYIPNEFEEDIAPRFRRFNERLDDDVFFRYNNHRMDYKEKIKKVLFYILFGNSFMIIRIFGRSNNCFQKYLNWMIYSILFISFFYQLIFINIISLIIIFTFSGFRTFIRKDISFYIKRFVVFNQSIFLIRFFKLLELWDRLFSEINLYPEKFVKIILP